MLKKIKFIGFLFLIFSVESSLGKTKSINVLQKVNHYSGSGKLVEKGSQSDHIDFGRIVFLFVKKPIMNLLPSSVDSPTMKKMVYLFPLTEVDLSNGKRMISKIKKIENRFYSINLEQVKVPVLGLKFTISYNPQTVSFDHRFFETISLKKGVEFRFFNKSLMNTLSKRLSGSTRVSSLLKKKQSLLIVGMEEKILGLLVAST